MAVMRRSSPTTRVDLVDLHEDQQLTHRQAGQVLGFGREWSRKWWRRYRHGGMAALTPPPRPASGPLARFSPRVQAAVLHYRRDYPRIGGRRARLALEQDPNLTGERLPDPRTIHRAWVHAGLVHQRRTTADTPPAPPAPPPPQDPHAVWQIDHQDHLQCPGIPTLLVLQSIRAPCAGLTVGADLFLGPHGAHGVAEDTILDALRRRLAQWGRPQALSVDGSLRLLGQPQRQFPSRLELFCAGLHIGVLPTRPGHPTDHAGVERLHRTLDGVLLGVAYPTLEAAQQALDQHLTALNERFPTRARVCHGQPPLQAYPEARHSGRSYDPAAEWDTFDLAAMDGVLAGWRWRRQVGAKSGQISFADRNVLIGKAWRGQVVDLRFDPRDRQVVVYAPGPALEALGPEIKRFPCAAFDKPTVLGVSAVAHRPTAPGELPGTVTGLPPPQGTTG